MRSVVSAIFVASALAFTVAAQGQQPAEDEKPAVQGQAPAAQGQAPATREQPPAAPAAKAVTISGCIQNAPAAASASGGAAPAGGAAPSAPAAPKFELASAKVVSESAVGTTGTTPVTRYRLDGDEKTITPHLNHQVEITGMVGPAATGAAAPMLKVESVKMIAAKCS